MTDVTLTKDQSVITGGLDDYDLFVFSMTPSEFSAAEEEALVSFVKSGKKFMGIHSATVMSPERTEYIDMIGGRFIHHSPYHEFPVKVVDPENPIVEGVQDFKITDELYVLDRAPEGANVLLTAFWEERDQPMLYLKKYGDGEMLYNALGHDTAAYENPSFKRIVVQGIKWLLR